MSYKADFIVKANKEGLPLLEGVDVNLLLVKEFLPEDYIQSITLQPGTYLLECWGAQGNYNRTAVLGGLGGYAKGSITLTEATEVYVAVGRGNALTTVAVFNGGGAAGSSAGSGGGASDIRIGGETLYDRIIVAAGGGGASYSGSVGGTGGGLEGTSTNGATGGTQTEGGSLNGAFGEGGGSASIYRGGGGGGWFGGGAASPSNTGGAGGSSYIGGEVTVGTEDFPKIPITNGVTESGVNVGNGKVIISSILNTETTDINGEMSFAGVTSGEYFISINHSGYVSFLDGFEVLEEDYFDEILLTPIELILSGIYLQVEIQPIAGSLIPIAEIQGIVNNIGLRIKGRQHVEINLNKEILQDDLETGDINDLTITEGEITLKRES